MQQMVEALVSEIKLRKTAWSDETISTIYFGGGTPSILSIEQLNLLIQTIKKHYAVDGEVEITMECNPENCTLENLSAWKSLGISRLSMGVQSFNNQQLQWMNRSHTNTNTISAIENAKKLDFNELNLDIIYGLPEQKDYDWEKELEQLVAFQPEHISAYCLTVESKTALANWVKTKKIEVPTTEHQAEQFEVLVKKLTEAGYEQYEISNFCRNAHYSKHNTAYWKGQKYIGIGPSAHGFDGENRYWNVSNNSLYIKNLNNEILPETIETLTSTDKFNETILLGLRTKWGVNKEQLFKHHVPNKKWEQTFRQKVDMELLYEKDTYFYLTEKGKLLADRIASDLFIVVD